MQDFVCLISRHHPRIREVLTLKTFCNEGHVVVTTSGTGHAIVDREFAKRRIDRKIVLRVPSFLGIGRLVASTHLISIVPRRLGEVLADQEKIKMLAPPVRLPPYAVKQHWHARFHAEPGNVWLRSVIARVLRV
jgi:DNA-binding transcriptional LysR family regulator